MSPISSTSSATLTEFQNFVLYILEYAKKNDREYLTKFQLLKFIYIVDFESRKFLGEPLISKVLFKKEKNGPVLAGDTYKEFCYLIDNKFINLTVVDNPEYGFKRHELALGKNNPRSNKLSSEKKIFINSVLTDWLEARQNALRTFVYSTEPIVNCVKEESSMTETQKQSYYKNNTIKMDIVSLDEDIS